MLRFFRNIRKRLIAGGRFRKYALYALGEIFIVVLGILIALSINNWNNERIRRQTERGIYQKLSDQIEADRAELTGTMAYNEAQFDLLSRLNQLAQRSDRRKTDTLVQYLPSLYEVSDFHRGGRIFQNLVNSGDYKFLDNASIVGKVQGLEELYIYINRLEEDHFRIIYEYGNLLLMEEVNFSTGQVKSPDVIDSFGFQNLLFGLLNITEEKDKAYRRALDEMKDLLTLLEKERKSKAPAQPEGGQ